MIGMIIFGLSTSVDAKEKSKSSTKNRKYRNVQIDPLFKSLEYPELMVQPLASKRLAMEAKDEQANKWKAFWPIQFSALTTLASSFVVDGQYKNDSSSTENKALDDAVQLSQLIGGSFLVGTLAISALYSPYQKCLDKLPTGNSKAERLTRERLAEEALYGASGFAWKITVLSVVSNLGASIFMATETNSENTVYPIFSAVASLTPLLFQNRWIQVSRLHRKYKKRIYGPLSDVQISPRLMLDHQKEAKLVSGLGLSATF